jgi:hypothetical protein
MNRFIKRYLLFVSLFLLTIILELVITNSIIDRKAIFNSKKTTKYIIAGDSHPECAFNDSLLPGFTNYAQSGESYFYTFFKIKKLIEQNKNIEAVFVEFTNNQITKEMDGKIWGDRYLSLRYPLYSPFMNVEDNKLLIQIIYPVIEMPRPIRLNTISIK